MNRLLLRPSQGFVFALLTPRGRYCLGLRLALFEPALPTLPRLALLATSPQPARLLTSLLLPSVIQTP